MNNSTKTSTKVFRDETGLDRIECWTDGYYVKLGRDVEEGRCLEFRVENFGEIENKLRRNGCAERFRAQTEDGSRASYVVYWDFGVYVIRDEEVVLRLGDDGYPIYQARGMAAEVRDDREAEEKASKFVESLRSYAKCECSQIGTTDRVAVKFYLDTSTVSMELLDTLRDHEAIEYPVRVGWDQDEQSLEYEFTVDTSGILNNE